MSTRMTFWLTCAQCGRPFSARTPDKWVCPWCERAMLSWLMGHPYSLYGNTRERLDVRVESAS